MGKKTDVLDPLGLASSVAFAYVILFVALMLVFDKIITRDGVVLPAINFLSNKPGFRDSLDDFLIDEYEIDKICWSSGFG